MGLTLLASLVSAQSYETSFASQKFDRTKGVATLHNGVKVDGATGALSMTTPLGPGIGARGAKYTPTFDLRWAPQLAMSEVITNTSGGRTSEVSTIPSGTTGALYPGFFEFLLDSGLASLGRISNYELPGGRTGILSGVLPTDSGGSSIPSNASLTQMLSGFGYSSGVSLQGSATVGSNGELIIGLNTSQNPGGSTTYATGPDTAGLTARNYPGQFVFIQGDTAYEFSYDHLISVSKTTVNPSNLSSPLHFVSRIGRYKLTRILNRFGEYIAFSYDAAVNYVLSGYSVTWSVNQNYAIHVTLNGSTIKVLYNTGSGNDPSYTISISSFPPNLQGNFPETLWGLITPSQIKNEGNQESVTFSYSPSRAIGPFQETLPLISSIQFPNRTQSFTWSDFNFASNSSIRSWTGNYAPTTTCITQCFGVTRIDDKADGQTRSTSHSRVIPQLVLNSAMTYGYLRAWQSTQFYDSITYPDGHVEVSLYASPASFGDTSLTAQMQSMLFLKHSVVEVRKYMSGTFSVSDLSLPAESSAAYSRIRNGSWDLHRVGNTSGSFSNGSLPYPKQTESWTLEGGQTVYKVESIDSSSWDVTNYCWKTSGVSVSLNGALQASKTINRLYEFDVSNWLQPRKTREQTTVNSDGTGSLAAGVSLPQNLPPVLWTYDSAGNSDLNRLQKTQVGDLSNGDPESLVTTFSYGSSGMSLALAQNVALTGSGDQSGLIGIHAYGYDPNGFMQSIQQKGVDWSSQQTADAYGRPTSQTDVNGHVVKYTYDSAGRLTDIAPQDGDVSTHIGYNDSDHRTISVTRGSQSSQYIYNGFGELVLEARSDGTTWSNRMYGIDAMGRKIAETTWAAGTGVYTNWTASNLIPPTGGSSTSGSTIYPSGSLLSYDSKGRLSLTVDPNGVSVQTFYDSALATRQVTKNASVYNPSTRSTGISDLSSTFTKDVLGRLVQIVDAAGQSTYYRFDAADRIKESHQTDTATGVEQVRYWVYDFLGRLVVLDQPESGVTYFTDFTVTGKPETTVYGLSRGTRPTNVNAKDTTLPSTLGVKVVSTSYDSLSRILAISSNDGSVSQSFGYDGQMGSGSSLTGGSFGLANGKCSYARDGGVEQGFTYASDFNGRLTMLQTRIGGSESVPNSENIDFFQSFTYDPYGNRVSASTPSNVTINTTYNTAIGMPTGVRYGSSSVATAVYDSTTWNLASLSGAGWMSRFGYDPNQQRVSTIVHANVDQTMTSNYGYDGAGRLVTLGETLSNLLPGDAAGSLSVTDTFGNDTLNRVISALVWNVDHGMEAQQAFSYDGFGNQTSSVASSLVGNLPNQTANTWCNINNFSFNSGELLTMASTNRLPATANGIPTGASYDAQGNLTRIAKLVTSSLTPMLTMTYDALGRVASVADSGTGITEKYHYTTDGLRTVVEMWSGGTLSKCRFNIYNDLRQVVSEYEYSDDGVNVGTPRMYATQVDHLGSPRIILDASGKVVGRQKYLPFGETLDQRGTYASAKGFTNHEQTDATGLIYMQARFYAPQFHKFMSPDPARDQHFEETQSWNIYSYVQNSPMMNFDPTGMVNNHMLDHDIDGVWQADPLAAMVNGEAATERVMSAAERAVLAQTNSTSGIIASGFALPGTTLPALALATGSLGAVPADKSAAAKVPENVKDFLTDKDVMSVMKSTAGKLAVDVNFVIAHSAYESGWGGEHAQELNNYFGLTKGGGKNLSFDSVQAGADKYFSIVDPKVHGAKTMDAYISGIRNAGFNAVNPKYDATLRSIYNMVVRSENALGITP